MHSSLAYTGFNMDDIKVMLTDHFGPWEKKGSWDAGRIGPSQGAIVTHAGTIKFDVNNVIHIKRSSILVEVK